MTSRKCAKGRQEILILLKKRGLVEAEERFGGDADQPPRSNDAVSMVSANSLKNTRTRNKSWKVQRRVPVPGKRCMRQLIKEVAHKGGKNSSSQ